MSLGLRDMSLDCNRPLLVLDKPNIDRYKQAKKNKSEIGILDEAVTHGDNANILSCDLRLQTYWAPAINHGCCENICALGERTEENL